MIAETHVVGLDVNDFVVLVHETDRMHNRRNTAVRAHGRDGIRLQILLFYFLYNTKLLKKTPPPRQS